MHCHSEGSVQQSRVTSTKPGWLTVPGSAEGGEGVDVGNGGTAGFFGLHSPWSRLVFAERLQCVVSPGQGVADAVPASPFHLPLSHNPPEGKNSTGS